MHAWQYHFQGCQPSSPINCESNSLARLAGQKRPDDVAHRLHLLPVDGTDDVTAQNDGSLAIGDNPFSRAKAGAIGRAAWRDLLNQEAFLYSKAEQIGQVAIQGLARKPQRRPIRVPH